jgi:hypothetical protein
VLIDLHVHTYASGDAVGAPEELIDRALDLGIDGLCITEHDSYEASETAAFLADDTGLVVLRGVEVTTNAGHMLLYGVCDDDWQGLAVAGCVDAQALVEYAGQREAVVIPAHPFRIDVPSSGEGLAALAGIFAIEGFNGAATRAENRQAVEFAARHGLKLTGGSDAHMSGHIGRAVTEFERRVETIEDLVTELRAGRFTGRYYIPHLSDSCSW